MTAWQSLGDVAARVVDAAGPVTFLVPGKPVPYARPAQTGKRRYTETSSASFMRVVGTFATRAMGARRMFTEPVRVELEFYSTTAGRADLDNYCKAALDGMSRIVFADDRLVTSIAASKHVAASRDDECTIITIRRAA